CAYATLLRPGGSSDVAMRNTWPAYASLGPTRPAISSQDSTSRLPPHSRPVITRSDGPCQLQPCDGHITGGAVRATGSAQSPGSSPHSGEAVSSYQPSVNSATRSDARWTGRGPPPRPRLTRTDPPW